MSTILQQERSNECSAGSYIIQDIEAHPAWRGRLSGLEADKLMRGGKIPYRYILRAGEYEGDYYVTYLLPDLSIKHQPFVINLTNDGWCFENTTPFAGPFTEAVIDDVIHLIMHCRKYACTPKANCE